MQQEIATETKIPKSSSFINAFQLIAMSQDLDLSGLFEEQASLKIRMLVTINLLGLFFNLSKPFFQCRMKINRKKCLDPSIQLMKP